MGETPVQHAADLDKHGFNVLPARHKGKAPQVPWQRFQDKRTSDKLKVWFSGSKARNYWVMTGRISGIVVLDCDNQAAEEFWAERIGRDLLDQTAAVKTRQGVHYYFKYPDRPVANWSEHGERIPGVHFDLRSDGTGVIAPPSVHESGHVYEWMRGPEQMGEAPGALRRTSEDRDDESGSSAPRSLLTELLGRPPAGVGGRNVWLTKVAGHYAKHFRTMRDAYEEHVRNANDRLDEPLEGDELEKLIESIWKAEQRKDGQDQPNEENGFLVSGGDRLLTQIRKKTGDTWVTDLAPWGDFDIVAVGVVEDEDANRTYDVEIRRRRQGDLKRGLLPATKLARAETLFSWLGEFGVGILPPEQMWPRSGTGGERLRRYLESQDPPHFRVVDYLGWHEGDGFVTHEGVIRKDGTHGFNKYQPDPKLRNWAPYRYGFMDEKVVRRTLQDVLTFHDETVCAVFGAWWVACFLKPQIQAVTSQFPFMALEAPSESGKTTGFFSLMLQLNGNTQGQVDPTRAALRDWMSAHQSGIVWIDDLSDTQHLMDLLRQATGEGSVGKKGEDRSTQEVVRLVAPVVISGEALQLSQQKALVDRAIQLDVPSPTHRRSLKDPKRLQWADIVKMKERHPDLTEMAGTIVNMALQYEDNVSRIPELAPVGGRFGDKIAILRFGARVLQDLSGLDWIEERVEDWCLQQDAIGNENTLTLKLLPTALAQTGWLSRPQGAEGRWPSTPVFWDEGERALWFSPQHLAQWWSEMKHGRIEKRTETVEALTQQGHALGLGGSSQRRRFSLGGDRNKKTVYWSITGDLARAILNRSRGEAPARGINVEQHRLALEARWEPE